MNKFIPRLIGCIIVKEGLSCQSFKFKKFYPLGSVKSSAEYFLKWGVDEIIIMNIDGNLININLLATSIKNINIPVCYGGGITTVEDAKKLLDVGVDKISVNNLAINDTSKIPNFINKFGSQFISASIDLIKKKNQYKVFCSKKKNIIDKDLNKFFFDLYNAGVGEIIIQSVDKDGTGAGYDLNLVKKIYKSSSLPILICGGAGSSKEVLKIAFKYKINPIVGNRLLHIENSAVYFKNEIFKKTNVSRENPFYKS
jgi:imidazole glycerol-phosphate synthase subunit HisF